MLLAVAGGTSCSRTRDGRLYRVYHNMHARYNGFFYATEAMKEADTKLLEGYDFDNFYINSVIISFQRGWL
jgi:hypothetical protein